MHSIYFTGREKGKEEKRKKKKKLDVFHGNTPNRDSSSYRERRNERLGDTRKFLRSQFLSSYFKKRAPLLTTLGDGFEDRQDPYQEMHTRRKGERERERERERESERERERERENDESLAGSPLYPLPFLLFLYSFSSFSLPNRSGWESSSCCRFEATIPLIRHEQVRTW